MAGRIDSVDTVRLLAITAIIAIHSGPFRATPPDPSADWYWLGVAVNQLARFGVPFFFIVSGYFFGYKVRGGSAPLEIAGKTSKRIFALFVTWSLLYLLPYNFSSIASLGVSGPLQLAGEQIQLLIDEPSRLIFVGAKGHLWFLSSLIVCTLLSAVLLRYRLAWLLVGLAIGCYLVGTLAKAYEATPWGIEFDFNTRNGPFFGLIFFVTGYLLAGVRNRANWFLYGCVLLLVGGALQLWEANYLATSYAATPYPDFVFATYLFGLGSALVALSNHPLLCNKKLATVGQLTLGIYALHYMFVDLLKPLDLMWDHPVWEFALVFIVLGLSVGLSQLLAKHPRTKKWVA